MICGFHWEREKKRSFRQSTFLGLGRVGGAWARDFAINEQRCSEHQRRSNTEPHVDDIGGRSNKEQMTRILDHDTQFQSHNDACGDKSGSGHFPGCGGRRIEQSIVVHVGGPAVHEPPEYAEMNEWIENSNMEAFGHKEGPQIHCRVEIEDSNHREEAFPRGKWTPLIGFHSEKPNEQFAQQDSQTVAQNHVDKNVVPPAFIEIGDHMAECEFENFENATENPGCPGFTNHQIACHPCKSMNTDPRSKHLIPKISNRIAKLIVRCEDGTLEGLSDGMEFIFEGRIEEGQKVAHILFVGTQEQDVEEDGNIDEIAREGEFSEDNLGTRVSEENENCSDTETNSDDERWGSSPPHNDATSKNHN